MRIGLVVSEFPPDTIGGGGEVFEGLALGLSGLGHTLKVVAPTTWGAPVAQDDQYPFPILRIPEFKHFSERYRTYMPPLPQYMPAARRFLRDCEVFNLHGYGAAFIDALFMCAVRKQNTVFTTHGFPYTAPLEGGILTAAYTLYDRVVGRRILRESAIVTAVSSPLARETEAVAARPVEVINNAFTPFDAATSPLPELMAQASRGPYVFCVGRLEPRKGFDKAIRVVACIRDQGVAMRLLIAGSDNGTGSSLRALANELGIADAVTFLGRVPRNQLSWLYERASIVLVPSVTESFSLVTLEAMSCGGATVVAAVGGIVDFAKDEQNCLLYPFDDTEAVVRAVMRFLRDPVLNERLRAGARATPQGYSWERIVAQYAATLERVRSSSAFAPA